MKYSGLLITILIFSNSIFGQKVQNNGFSKVLEKHLKHGVPEIDVKDLEKMSGFILLDTREKKEYDVSHIKGARWVGFSTFDLNKLEDIDKDQLIVTYCSVGARSEGVAKNLLNKGYTKVYNLYGGIFEWTNRGNEVVGLDEKPTNKVHGVTKEWASWVMKADAVLP